MIWNLFALCVLIHTASSQTQPQHPYKNCHGRNDPHMQSFGGLNYEFQVGGYYELFNDTNGAVVAAGFQQCSAYSSAYCNCAAYVVADRQLVLRTDHCGVALTPASNAFYFDDLVANSYGNPTDCETTTVPVANQYDDAWWSGNGHDVNGQGKLKCARVDDPNIDYIIIRFVSKNIYYTVRRSVGYGIFEVMVSVDENLPGPVKGLCGDLDASSANDFFTPDDGVLDPNNPTDFAIAQDYYTFQIPTCGPCGGYDANGFWCLVKNGKCTVEQLGLVATDRDFLLDGDRKGDQIGEDVAKDACANAVQNDLHNAAVGLGITDQEKLDKQIADCVKDVVADGNLVWAQAYKDYGLTLVIATADPENPEHQNLVEKIRTVLPPIKHKWVDCHSRNDPHFQTFDNFHFDFHGVGTQYLMFADTLNFPNTFVAASFQACNPGSTVSCNCGVYAVSGDTVIRSSHCGVAATPATLQFFYDTPTLYGVQAQCWLSTILNPADQFNDVWWLFNGVPINGKFKCATVAGTQNVVIKYLNSPVYVAVNQMTGWGIFDIHIRIRSLSCFGHTFGLCGLHNNDPADDRSRPIRYREIYCPRICGGYSTIDTNACRVASNLCTFKQNGLATTATRSSSSVQAKPLTNPADAQAICDKHIRTDVANAAVEVGIVGKEDFERLNRDCQFDLTNTGDEGWARGYNILNLNNIARDADQNDPKQKEIAAWAAKYLAAATQIKPVLTAVNTAIKA